MKTTQLAKRIKAKTGKDFSIKDTNGKTTITASVFNQYFDLLNQ
jgi:hypothetical protein